MVVIALQLYFGLTVTLVCKLVQYGEERKVARVYNFSAGPAVLPEEVLKEAAEEMLDYKGSGMSVMEMSHRSKVYDTIIKEAEADLRTLLQIPDNYKVLFLQGGASLLFASVPMNLMKNRKAGYILTGQWAKKAFAEAKIYGEAVELASSADETFLIYRTAPIFPLPKIWIMFTFVRTTLSMGPSIINFLTRRVRFWFLMYLPVSCQSPWT